MSSEHGTATEDFIDYLCTTAFLRDFTIRSPDFCKSGGLRKEVADVMLMFDEYLLAFQVKSRKLSSLDFATNPTELARIAAKATDATRQVGTLTRAMRAGRLGHIRNRYGISFRQDPSNWKLVGIAVLALSGTTSAPDRALLPGVPFFAHEPHGSPVHYFMRHEFELVVAELDTLPDLIRYLEFRQFASENGLINPNVREPDLLATFKTRWDLIRRSYDERLGLVVRHGAWRRYVTNQAQAIARRNQDNKISYVIDRWIEWMHSMLGYDAPHIDRTDSDFSQVNGTEGYVETILELARIPRVGRREIGKRVFEKCERAIHRERSYFLHIMRPGHGFLFVSTRMERTQRMKALRAMAMLAYCAQDLRSIFAICTEPADCVEMSLDTVILKGFEPPDKDDLKRQGLELFKPQVWTSVTEYGD